MRLMDMVFVGVALAALLYFGWSAGYQMGRDQESRRCSALSWSCR